MLRDVNREPEFGIPVRLIHRNRHGVIRKRGWELLHGNEREWELTTVAKFPHYTTVLVISHDTKFVYTIECKLELARDLVKGVADHSVSLPVT